MEGGCLGYPGASTVASQSLDRQLPPWLANPRNPPMSPHSRHPSHWWNSGRKKNRDGRGGKTLWSAPQTTAQMPTEELADPGRVQSYHKPCEPTLMRLTAGCPLHSWAAWLLSLWTAWPLNLWTAKFVDRLTAKFGNRLTAKLMNRLTAKLVDRLTAKLVVVNLVKLHLTKFNQLPRLSGRWVPGIPRGFHCGQPAPR